MVEERKARWPNRPYTMQQTRRATVSIGEARRGKPWRGLVRLGKAGNGRPRRGKARRVSTHPSVDSASVLPNRQPGGVRTRCRWSRPGGPLLARMRPRLIATSEGGLVIRLPRHIKIAVALIGALAAVNLVLYLTPAGAGLTTQELRQKVREHRQQTWYWQDIRLVPRTPSSGQERTASSRTYLRWLSHRWYARRLIAKHAAMAVPHYREWLCIHSYEGSWTDPNAPYYGGLQMDMSFQRAHGWDALQRWGTADHWHPLTQMWVAERAYRTRGFYPWPNTARYCGLI